MMKRLMVLGVCMSLLAVTAASYAEDVYITRRGKKYHKADCPLIQNRDTTVIDDEEAKEKGLAPCKKCFRQEALEAKTPKRSKKVKTSKKKKSTQE